ncbi:MAG: hypothetical protein ABDH37_07735 [Candidatus Hydrothermales bacterium]
MEKITQFFEIFSNSYIFKDFYSFSFNMNSFKTRYDSLISTKLFFRRNIDKINFLKDLKFAYQNNFKGIYSYINISSPAFYNKHKDSIGRFSFYDQSIISFLYLKSLRTGLGLKMLNKKFERNLSPFIFFNSDIMGINYLINLYIFDNKLLPSFKLFYFNELFFFMTGFSKKIEFFNPLEEYSFLLFNFPFLIEKGERNFVSLIFYEFFLNIKRIIIKFGYKKFFDNLFDALIFENEKFLVKKRKNLEVTSLEFYFFNKTSFRYENYNKEPIFLYLIYKINYKNFIFEPKLIYINKNNLFAFKFKTAYILKKKFTLFIQYDYFRPESSILKREVKFGIQKRF